MSLFPIRRSMPTDPIQRVEYALDKFGNTVLRLACAQAGDIHNAEDVSQDVFLKLLTADTHFENDDHLKAWLIRVTVNLCHDQGRKRHRKPISSINDLPIEPIQPSGASYEDMAAAWEAIERLPEDQRVVIHLICVEGYSTDEVARILGVSNGAVRSRLSRARKTLRSNVLDAANAAQRSPAPHGTTCPSPTNPAQGA